MIRLHFSLKGLLSGLLVAAVMVAHAAGTELIDFSRKSSLIAKDGLFGNDVTIDNFPLPYVNNSIGPFDHSKSTAVERMVNGVDGTGRPQYQTASLTYDLGSNTFTVPNTQATDEVNMWIHVDGPVVDNPGSAPFSGRETRPWLIELQLLTNGNKVYTSYRRRCSRGWNELNFPITTEVPVSNCPDQALSRRIRHFTVSGSTGTLVNRIKIRILGSNDATDAHVINRVCFNTCKLQPIKRPVPIILMYDDGWKGVLTYAKPLIDQFNMRASVSVIGMYYVGQADSLHLNKTDLDFIYNDNSRWDMVNHTYDHSNLHNAGAPLSYNTVYNNIKLGMDAIAGFTRNNGNKFLCYPGGMCDGQVFAAMDQLGVVAGRVNSPEWDPNGNTDLMQNPYSLAGYLTCSAENGVDGYNPNYSLEQFKDWIEEGIAEGKPRIVILHDVIPPTDPGISTRNPRSWNTTTWHEAMMNYLGGLGSVVTFKSLPEWYNGLDALHKTRGIRY